MCNLLQVFSFRTDLASCDQWFLGAFHHQILKFATVLHPLPHLHLQSFHRSLLRLPGGLTSLELNELDVIYAFWHDASRDAHRDVDRLQL